MWNDAISTLTSKYGNPIIGVVSDTLKMADRRYYWKCENKVICYHINSEYSSYLTYMVNSHVLNIIRDDQIKNMKQKEDSISKAKREHKEFLEQIKKDSLANIKKLENEQKKKKQIKESTSNSI